MGNYLIVGNTSGIGKDLSAQLITAGHSVFAINRRFPESATHSFCADVTIDTLPAIAAPLDGITYCPGSITLKPFRGLKQEDILNDMQVNLLGAVRVLQHYLPNLKMATHPSVVLFSTVAVATGMPYHASIAMAKGAVEGLVRSLAAEWAPTIRVNCIAPSLTDTPLAAKLLETDAKREAGAARHPLKTVGRSEDIARMALLLLGDSTRFVTGQVWHMDGGLSSTRI
jgi:3-oxoacyl-[acyl-carrier protein] reductase